jgi:hypothetical protein
MASKKITRLKIKNIFLSNYLWHITYGYQGLWGPGGLYRKPFVNTKKAKNAIGTYAIGS